MRSRESLRTWMEKLLPAAGPCAQLAGALLLRSLLVGFTTHLSQLARQADRAGSVRIRRQFFSRWLHRPHFEPETIYAKLNRWTRRLLAHEKRILLLVDFTELSEQWSVLQVSVPWQGRALPLYRAVVHHTDPEIGRRELLRTALAFLAAHLPGPRSHYVVVADRGLPGHWLIRDLQEAGWRYALRVASTWKVTHRDYTGLLADAPPVPELVGPSPKRLEAAVLGRQGKGRDEWSRSHVVLYHGEGHQEPWYLATSEEADAAVAIYRERMKIECEFRDVKGPFGLDELAHWPDRERVARFLAVVAVYEWRLASLWVRHQLHRWGDFLANKSKLSWIRITREWIQHRLRRAARPALTSL